MHKRVIQPETGLKFRPSLSGLCFYENHIFNYPFFLKLVEYFKDSSVKFKNNSSQDRTQKNNLFFFFFFFCET